MKKVIALLIISLSIGVAAKAQKRRRAPSRNTGQPADSTNNKPRILGSTIIITTKNGDRITGELLDLTAYSARIKADNLESSIALDTVASISFDRAVVVAPAAQSIGSVRPDFAREAEPLLGIFQTLAASLKPGVDYTEYGRQLSELRRASDRLVTKYSATENPAEAHSVSLLAGAMTDYTWARTVWTLKFGRSSDGTVSETESPIVADSLTLYPDLRTASAAGTRISAEKLISGLWGKAAEKIARVRTLIGPAR
jgi:hypothetical protein